MKPKTSPTSPKAKKRNSKESIEELYKENMQVIEKPKNRKLGNFIGLLLFVLVFGFLSACIGLLVLVSYGSDIPFLNKIAVFSNQGQQPSIILGTKRSASTADDIRKLAQETKKSIIQLYIKPEDADNSIDGVYQPQNFIGSAIVLSNDGYLVVLDEKIQGQDEASIVGISYDGSVYAVESAIDDPASPYSFVKVEASDLTSVSMAVSNSVLYQSELILVGRSDIRSEPIIGKTAVSQPRFISVNQESDYLFSSEAYNYRMLLENGIGQNFQDYIAFSLQQEAVGAVTIVDGSTVIVPLWQLSSIIGTVLEDQEVKRPYLGIEYINLEQAITLSFEVQQQQGAYIRSVAEDSPAEKADLRMGDIITKADSETVEAKKDLSEIVLSKEAGDSCTLTIIREGEEMSKKIILGEL